MVFEMFIAKRLLKTNHHGEYVYGAHDYMGRIFNAAIELTTILGYYPYAIDIERKQKTRMSVY